MLYASSRKTLFAYNPNTNKLTQIAKNLPGPTEGLDMRPDGRLALGVHGSLTIYAYDVIAKQVVPAENILTPYNDVEGIAWPVCTP